MGKIHSWNIHCWSSNKVQASGRLIRNLNDFGIRILSDPRLVNKKYGKVILDSLPVNPILYSSIDVILKTNSFFKEFKA